MNMNINMNELKMLMHGKINRYQNLDHILTAYNIINIK